MERQTNIKVLILGPARVLSDICRRFTIFFWPTWTPGAERLQNHKQIEKQTGPAYFFTVQQRELSPLPLPTVDLLASKGASPTPSEILERESHLSDPLLRGGGVTCVASEVKEEERSRAGPVSPGLAHKPTHMLDRCLFYSCPLLGELNRAIVQVFLLPGGREVLLSLFPLAGLTGRRRGCCRRVFFLHAHPLPLQRPTVGVGGRGVIPGLQREGSC